MYAERDRQRNQRERNSYLLDQRIFSPNDSFSIVDFDWHRHPLFQLNLMQNRRHRNKQQMIQTFDKHKHLAQTQRANQISIALIKIVICLYVSIVSERRYQQQLSHQVWPFNKMLVLIVIIMKLNSGSSKCNNSTPFAQNCIQIDYWHGKHQYKTFIYSWRLTPKPKTKDTFFTENPHIYCQLPTQQISREIIHY